MPEDEHELYGLLIEGIASRLYRMQYWETGSFKRNGAELIVDAPYYYHMHETTFERCSELLWRLGILRSISENNKWDCIFRFVVLPEQAACVAELPIDDKPSFPDVLSAYIDLRSNYGVPCIEAGRAFEVQQCEESIYFKLATAGYVECVGQAYKWTSKARIALEATCLCEWDDSVRH